MTKKIIKKTKLQARCGRAHTGCSHSLAQALHRTGLCRAYSEDYLRLTKQSCNYQSCLNRKGKALGL